MDIIDEIKNQYETGDYFPRSLGIELLELSPGFSKVAITVGPEMVNLHGIGHGGMIFTLADTAFGLACNSHGIPAVAMTNTIDYLAPARLGERLIATGEERQRSRKTGNYEIKVTSDNGKLVAIVRGIAYFHSTESK